MHNDWQDTAYEELEALLGYAFQRRELLLTAFTHSSYAWYYGVESNERLEFLGDAVMQLVVTEMLLYASSEDEGKLTERRKQYVSKPALEEAERRLDLMRYLRYFGGKESIGGKTRSNLFEAVTGAIYLDGGLAAAAKFLKTHLALIEAENYKNALQELAQERQKETPHYRTVETEAGFACTVSALGASASGMGASKKSAEMDAAKKLLEKLHKLHKGE